MPMTAPRTWRSWCCASSFGCCAQDRPSQVHRTRPGPAGCRQPGAPPTAVGIVAGHAPDAAALAPHPGPAQVDLRQEAHAWPTTDRPADRSTDPADGQGQRPMGLPGDLRGAARAWHPRGRHHHQDAAATTRPWPVATTQRTDLDAVPASQAEGIIGCDFFTVETIRRKTLFVLFLIHLSSRRVVLAGVTAHPDTAWSPSRQGTWR
jgi:hypothetical protein